MISDTYNFAIERIRGDGVAGNLRPKTCGKINHKIAYTHCTGIRRRHSIWECRLFYVGRLRETPYIEGFSVNFYKRTLRENADTKGSAAPIDSGGNVVVTVGIRLTGPRRVKVRGNVGIRINCACDIVHGVSNGLSIVKGVGVRELLDTSTR